MNRFLLLALTAGLLSGCMSKRDICAKYASGEQGYNYYQTAKKLGIKGGEVNSIRNFCAFYKK